MDLNLAASFSGRQQHEMRLGGADVSTLSQQATCGSTVCFDSCLSKDFNWERLRGLNINLVNQPTEEDHLNQWLKMPHSILKLKRLKRLKHLVMAGLEENDMLMKKLRVQFKRLNGPSVDCLLFQVLESKLAYDHRIAYSLFIIVHHHKRP